MPNSEQKCAHFCSEWSIVGYVTGAFWDLWNCSIVTVWIQPYAHKSSANVVYQSHYSRSQYPRNEIVTFRRVDSHFSSNRAKYSRHMPTSWPEKSQTIPACRNERGTITIKQISTKSGPEISQSLFCPCISSVVLPVWNFGRSLNPSNNTMLYDKIETG